MRMYLEFLRFPGAKSLLLAPFPARLAYGMIGLGLYFKVYRETNSIAAAGFAAGASGIAGAATTGLRASLLDKYGLKWPIRLFVPGYATAIMAVNFSHDKTLLIFSAILLGASAPPINLSIRPLWRFLVPHHMLRTANAMDTAFMDGAVIIGPALVTALALSSHPFTALAACSFLILLGGLSLSSLEVTKKWEPEEKSKNELRFFKLPAIRVLALEGIAIGLSNGLFSIALPAFATINRTPRLTAIVMAISAGAMIIGGLIGAAVTRHLTPLRAFTKNYFFWFIAVLPLPFVRANWTIMVVAAIIGLAVGAQQVFYLEVLDHVRPKGTAASALGWMWVIEGTAASVGSAIAGVISERFSPNICFALTALAVTAGYLVTLSGNRFLRSADTLLPPVKD